MLTDMSRRVLEAPDNVKVREEIKELTKVIERKYPGIVQANDCDFLLSTL